MNLGVQVKRGIKRKQQDLQDDAVVVERKPKPCNICDRNANDDDDAEPRKKKMRWCYPHQARICPLTNLEFVQGRECHYCWKACLSLTHIVVCRARLLAMRSLLFCVDSEATFPHALTHTHTHTCAETRTLHPEYKRMKPSEVAANYKSEETAEFKDGFEVVCDANLSLVHVML